MQAAHGRQRIAALAVACLALTVTLTATGPSHAKKRGKPRIAGTYRATTSDNFPVALNVSRGGVVSGLQLQMTVYGQGCGTSRLASVPAPIVLKPVTRSKREGEYKGLDSDGQNMLGVQLKLDASSRVLHGIVKTESTVLFDPVDGYPLCFGKTTFDAKRR